MLHGISFLKVQRVVTEEIDSGLFQWLSALTLKEDDTMASALMELMRPEVEKYAEGKVKSYAKETYTKQARIMLQHGENNEYIKLLTHLTDQEIEALRQTGQ